MYFKEGTVTEKHNEKHLAQKRTEIKRIWHGHLKSLLKQKKKKKKVFVINVHYHTSLHYLHILEYGLQVNH